MTLARGDKVIKLGPDGEPLTTDQESYIEYEVFDMGTHNSLRRLHGYAESPSEADSEADVFIVALLRKVR